MKTLVELLDREELDEIFRHFSSITGLGVTLHDIDGNILMSCKQEDACICSLIGRHPMCYDSIKFSMRKAAELGEPYIYACACGLIMNASAVMLDDELIGAVLCGPAMLWDANDFDIDELEAATSNTALTDDDRLKIVKNTPRLTCGDMTSASRILFRLVNYMCKIRSEYFSQRQEITKQQATISLLLYEHKTKAGERADFYSPETEKQFLIYVRLGDTPNAKRLLNTILADIFLKSGGNSSTMVVKIYELTSFLYQTAFEAGVSGENLIEIARETQAILSDAISFEELCYSTSRILERYIGAIYNMHPNISGGRYLTEATAYLTQWYKEDVTLQSLAEKLYISPSYLSHLFKYGLNTTFTKTLTKIRIEAAKKQLTQTDLSVCEIAENAGYSDPSYFIRAFKKAIGLTPAKFRQLSTEGNKNDDQKK